MRQYVIKRAWFNAEVIRHLLPQGDFISQVNLLIEVKQGPGLLQMYHLLKLYAF